MPSCCTLPWSEQGKDSNGAGGREMALGFRGLTVLPSLRKTVCCILGSLPQESQKLVPSFTRDPPVPGIKPLLIS